MSNVLCFRFLLQNIFHYYFIQLSVFNFSIAKATKFGSGVTDL